MRRTDARRRASTRQPRARPHSPQALGVRVTWRRKPAAFMNLGDCHGNEANVSAVRSETQAHTRVSRAHAFTGRASRDQRSARQGSAPNRRLSLGSPATAAVSRRLATAQRLRKASEFAPLAAGAAPYRAARRWIAVAGRLRAVVPDEDAGAAVRFGFTVGRRHARRAVDRSAVKRVLREAARHAAENIERAAAPLRFDVVLRLKAPLPPTDTMTRRAWKRALRNEADQLLAELERRLSAAGAPRRDDPARGGERPI